MSASDIGVGRRWSVDISDALEKSDFGIICLTPENTNSPWVLFEAGAVSKKEEGRVVPFILDLETTDVKGPLSTFQAVRADKEGTLDLLKGIQEVATSIGGRARSEDDAHRLFEKLWPEFRADLEKARELKTGGQGKLPSRADGELLAEILSGVRQLLREDVGGAIHKLSDNMKQSIGLTKHQLSAMEYMDGFFEFGLESEEIQRAAKICVGLSYSETNYGQILDQLKEVDLGDFDALFNRLSRADIAPGMFIKELVSRATRK